MLFRSMAVLGSIQPQPIENEADGTLALSAIEAAIKPDDPHFARTRLICMENTTGGKVLPMDYLKAVRRLAQSRGLSTHLDGARLFNAAVEIARRRGEGRREHDHEGSSVSDPRQVAREIAQSFDSVSMCLSKGLGAPVGSLLLGSEALIARARRWRKMLGGGMRQAGILAAAAHHALEHHVDRMALDHERARRLAQGFIEAAKAQPSLLTIPQFPQTNIFFARVDRSIAPRFAAHLAECGIHVTGKAGLDGHVTQRWVTHLDVDDGDIDLALKSVAKFFQGLRPD